LETIAAALKYNLTIEVRCNLEFDWIIFHFIQRFIHKLVLIHSILDTKML